LFQGRDLLLKQVRLLLIDKGFGDYCLYPDPYYPIWKYFDLGSSQGPSGFDAEVFIGAAVESFRGLLCSVDPIDQVLKSLPGKTALPPAAQRSLKSVAFLDTETSGTGRSAKVAELAIVCAAYDEIGDQIVGVLEEYSFKAPDTLNEGKVRSLLERTSAIVAHHAEFDRSVLERTLPGVDKLPWLCSWRGIEWKKLAGVQSESLETLLGAEGLCYEQEHTALADARDLLRLLAVQRDGKTYLARLLSSTTS
jgi:DNA polymerase-3 subunit epsilon